VSSGKIKPAAEGEVVNEAAVLFERALEKPQYKDLLSAIDARLKKCANNLMVAARRRMKESNWNFDRDRYQAAILTLIQVDPAKRTLLDFHMAAARNTEADNLYRQRKTVEATKTWIEAADLFMKSARSQPSIRETGFHMAAKSYYRAMTEAQKFETKAPGLFQQVDKLGRKALMAFDEFQKHIKRVQAAYGEAEKRRKRSAEAALAKPVIYYGLGDLAKTIETADEYLKLEEKDERFVPTVMWTRFKALCDLATGAVGTDGEGAALKRVEEAASGFSKSKDMKRFYGPACSMVSATFTKALQRVNGLLKSGEGDKVALTERARVYKRKYGEWMQRLIDLDPKRKEDLGFMASIAKVFYDQKAYENARKLYKDAIETHDPSNSGKKVALDERMFELAAKKTVFDKESKTDAVRKKIRSLTELVFGEPEKERTKKDGTVKPPRERNWQKALGIVIKLLKEHPKIQCAADLKKTRKELSFRLQMLTVRLNLSDCTRALAKEIGETNPEEAKKLWTEAIELLETVRKYWWRDNELRFLLAECYEALEDYKKALEMYAAAGRSAAEYSSTQYNANVRFSRVAFKKGDFREAMRFPYMLVSGVYAAEQEWKQYFPDAQEFVEKCEEGITNKGEAVVVKNIEITEDVDYSNLMSDKDEKLNEELTAIRRRLEEGFIEEGEKADLQRNAFELHFKTLITNAIDGPVNAARAKLIKKKQVAGKQKMFLAQLLYQSPFTFGKFRELAVKLELFKAADDPMPLKYLTDKQKEKAIELGLLNDDGSLKDTKEIDPDLLRTESSTDVKEEVVPPTGEAPAEGAGEAAEDGGGGGDAPAAEEAPANEEGEADYAAPANDDAPANEAPANEEGVNE